MPPASTAATHQGNLRYGLEAAVNFLNISFDENSFLSGDVTRASTTYQLEPGTQHLSRKRQRRNKESVADASGSEAIREDYAAFVTFFG